MVGDELDFDTSGESSSRFGSAVSATIRLMQALGAAATLTGVALFGVLRYLYDRFYGAFGLSPEEVGLDFLAVVGRGGLVVAAIFLVGAVLVGLGYALGTFVFVSIVDPSPARRLLPRPHLGPRWTSVLVVLAIVLAIGGIEFAADRATARVAERYEQVTRGFTVEPSSMMEIRVEPVTVEWAGDGPPPVEISESLMLLGAGDDTVFVFDLDRQSLVRLPATDVVVVQRCNPAYPDLCLAPQAPDLDCEDLPTVNVRVNEPDPYGFDADGDGIGCEGDAPPSNTLPRLAMGALLSLAVAAARFAHLWGFRPRE